MVNRWQVRSRTERRACLLYLAALLSAPGCGPSTAESSAGPADAIAADGHERTPALGLPKSLDLGIVELGTTACQQLQVANTGVDVLEIRKVDFLADSGFTLQVELSDRRDAAFGPGPQAHFEPPLRVDPQAVIGMNICFAAVSFSKALATLTFRTNDPQPAGGGEVTIVANAEVPCLQLVPSGELTFGAVKVDEQAVREVRIGSCGSAPLRVDRIEFSGGGVGAYALRFAKMAAAYPGVDAKDGPSEAAPLLIPPQGHALLEVVYAPFLESLVNPDSGALEPTTATIDVRSNAYVPKNTLHCVGTSVASTCPTAKAWVVEGEVVVPQTTLHLKGDDSVGAGGAVIKDYKWTAKQPVGPMQAFVPSNTVANPTFTVGAAGAYEFCLSVTDANLLQSCSVSCVTVLVVPGEAIHVELLWNTPADPDQTDTGPSAGSDLDLHVANHLAAGPDLDCDGQGDPWFHLPFDAFWFNPHPDWGSPIEVANDDPSLDLDDTDGAGPENLTLASPEGTMAKPASYSVGVHHANDHGFGTSEATVNVYIFGVLALQIDSVPLNAGDLWYVGKIHWPNKITDKAAAALEPVEICYQTGDPCKGGKRWVPKGDWCIATCYDGSGLSSKKTAAMPSGCEAGAP